ncbi:tRNA (guanosine(46)-N7)-methyltransferase TrmB [Campylobacter upsaliensis]|uniref:tRNA (guanosine(46)-N7)-methyltransferase TrmB n=1 Tax=Campylobacter upsaliensis TaxID=28080 RepID=UPI0022EA1280|nr:tRNA (guanosine(46)-N7)-methyltransferase TrmB [Campylobacter upsaliensis]HEC1549537.1 tRNA (guanosine(46)-N7)-methyltransferase TrmB [Campylobacter upsaliensis]HEC1569871.1 tRNA (guanosine(46)-N7)-methyltransferase TrmB [Campylobacter upsaliensis]HEC1575540.1 tRNA (guanosine(46)-N7)-methyltransferase TrmB [Campylobacter upsaliensis]
MPNFKTKSIKKLTLPFEKDGVSFLFKAENASVTLIFTQLLEQSFFLQIKKEKNAFIIKADKHSKPSKIGYLQKALKVFKENFCEGILNEAFGLKNNALVEQTPLIARDLEELSIRLEKEEKIYIEIGFGSGRHLLFKAKQNPQILMLGVEIYTPSLTQVAKLAKAQNLNNVLLIQSDARLLLSILKTKSIEKIFLHFPVPWEDKPHRRVISEAFCKECARVLRGEFELRTDSYAYFDFALKEFLIFSKPQFLLKKNENLEISSKYEDRWKKQEKDIYDLIVWGLDMPEENQSEEKLDLTNLHLNASQMRAFWEQFEKKSIRGEAYFLSFRNLYESEKGFILKCAFGAFNAPTHAYILFGKKTEFLFKNPLKTQENLKALGELKRKIEQFS